MNTEINYISGAIGVSVPCTQTGKNYLPYIPEIVNKVVRFVDFYSTLTTDPQNRLLSGDMNNFISFMEAGTKKLFIKDLRLREINPQLMRGRRLKINRVIDAVNSYISVMSAANVGKCFYLVFWYDDEKSANPISATEQTENIGFEFKTRYNDANIYPFGENRTLTGKWFKNIFAYPLQAEIPMMRAKVTADAPATAPTGAQVLSPNGVETITNFASCYLTLQKDNYMFVKSVPVIAFNQQSFVETLTLKNCEVDFYNSYILYAGATPEDVNGKCFCFTAQIKKD